VEERQAAVSAVLKAGHIPAGMELFTAGDRSQMVTIKEWIDESDVYMLILGGRYGSIEKTSGISYTELEYDYALQQKKPVFAVVISDLALDAKIKAGGRSFIENNEPKALALFREKVLSNISSFFEDKKDIKLCIHESLADFATKRELKGWVSADEVIDTKPLFDEITKLSEENRSLKETLSIMEKRSPTERSLADKKDENYDELKAVLLGIEIKIPASIADAKKDITRDLLYVFYASRDILINGVTNRNGVSEHEIFLYYNICPKLQIHRLILNEKVPGVQWRRSYVSPLGTEFLAHMDRLVHQKKQVQKQTPKIPVGSIKKETSLGTSRAKV
jgi:hypothetical protein